jgi:hypothetical protein
VTSGTFVDGLLTAGARRDIEDVEERPRAPTPSIRSPTIVAFRLIRDNAATRQRQQ